MPSSTYAPPYARAEQVWWCCFFNDTATTEIYTLSLHDALPIYEAGRDREAGAQQRAQAGALAAGAVEREVGVVEAKGERAQDRKSTRLNSSHANISYAVFCLKKKTSTSTRSC